jgi:hypothetical protein
VVEEELAVGLNLLEAVLAILAVVVEDPTETVME